MKKYLLAILVASLVIGGAAFVWASIIGSPHDLAPEPCAMCHTPHSGTGDYPLWNRTQVAQTWTVYESISFDMAPADNPPRTPSSLCLVCHDGVASQLVNYPGPCSNPDAAYDITVAGCANLGTDLTNDHPISFNYNDMLDNDGNYFPPATAIRTTPTNRYAIVGAYSGTNYWLYQDPASPSSGYGFECATCHSVHDLATYQGKGSDQVYFLRNDNSGSLMCLDCHTAR